VAGCFAYGHHGSIVHLTLACALLLLLLLVLVLWLCCCRTPGFTGADLQNLMNEAAILAARRDLKEISKEEIADALERIIAGTQQQTHTHTCELHTLHTMLPQQQQ